MSDTTLQDFKDTTIEPLYEKFQQTLQDTQSVLTECLNQLVVGVVPATENVQLSVERINLLRSLYQDIVQETKRAIAPEECPVEGSSAECYVKAYAASKRVAQELRIKKIRSVIETFLKIRSSVEKYAEALQPFQKKSRLLLDLPIDGYDPETNPVEDLEIFLQAVRCKDLDSEQGIQMLEFLSDHYPVRVMLGIQGGKYMLDDDPQPDPRTPTDPAYKPEKTSTPELGDVPAPKSEKAAMSKPKEESASKPEEASLFEPTSSMIEAVIVCSSDKVNVSKFQKQIQNAPSIVRSLLPIITNLGILTEKQFCRMELLMDNFEKLEICQERVKLGVQYLTKHEILTAYQLPYLSEPVYCLSSYGYNAFSKKTIQNWRESPPEMHLRYVDSCK